MKGNGDITLLMAMVHSHMQTVMYLLVSGLRVRNMEVVNYDMSTGILFKVSGPRIGL
jgi:hypothetical protein